MVAIAKAAPKSSIPHNVEAEQQVLGALLLEASRIALISESRAIFADPAHADLFQEIRMRHGRNELVSPVALAHEGMLELGGPAYLARLSGSSVAGHHVAELTTLLADLRDKRELRAAGACGDIAAGLEAHLVLRGASGHPRRSR